MRIKLALAANCSLCGKLRARGTEVNWDKKRITCLDCELPADESLPLPSYQSARELALDTLKAVRTFLEGKEATPETLALLGRIDVTIKQWEK